LDQDVAALLARVRKKQNASLKAVVNAALRQGLLNMTSAPKTRRVFRPEEVSPGRCFIPDLDNISEVLAAVEGENYR